MQIEQAFGADGVHFDLQRLDGAAGPLFPLSTETTVDATLMLRTLEALWLEDRLEATEEGYLLPIETFYDLEPVELEALGFAGRPTEVSVRLRSSGIPGRPDFGIRAITSHPEHGLLPEEMRHGPFFMIGDETFYVSEDVAKLYRVLDRGASTDPSGQLVYIGDVKDAADACGAELDRFLEREDIVRPQGIGVEVTVEGDEEVELQPVLEGFDEDDFEAFRGDARTRSFYTQAELDRRTRLVLDRDERAKADAIRERRRITGPDVPRFFDNPEAFLPDGIDLEQFSLRVRGLIPRRYTSQPYVRVVGQGRDWLGISTTIEITDPDAVGPGMEVGPTTTGVGRGTAPDDVVDQRDDLNGAPPSVSPDDYADLCRQVMETGEPWVKHEGSWLEIDPETAKRYLDAWDAIEVDDAGQQRISITHVPLVLDVISNLEALEYDEGAPGTATLPADLPEHAPPEALQAKLMPHQLVGYRWLRYLLEHRMGGLLADDMGLGKTVQVIALMAHLAEHDRLRPALLVLPKVLIQNWHQEIQRFCPVIQRIYHHHGTDRLRNPERIAQAEVVLTTYQTLRRDQLTLGQIDWQLIACDEAQYVKNPTAQATSAVKGMKSELRLALTGTPVENGLSELWCIVDFAQPGKLGSQKEFRDVFERPIRTADETSPRRRELASELQQRLVPNYIRRTKEDVLEDLPSRLPDRYARVPFGERQARLYASIIQQLQADKMIPIQALQHLIAIASHPELFEPSGSPIDALIAECPKLAATVEIIDEIVAQGEKVVIFTRYRRMQQILQDMVRERFGVHAAIINGEVGSDRRLGLVDRLNDAPGFHALILSPDAAGVGLNVTGANHVIHYTRLWNPAKENQATDRVHRIGQRRPVQVYYPIVEGDGFHTVEERLDELLAEKQALARDVVWPRESLSAEREMLDFLTEPAVAQ